jgi:predicted secreted protein
VLPRAAPQRPLRRLAVLIACALVVACGEEGAGGSEAFAQRCVGDARLDPPTCRCIADSLSEREGIGDDPAALERTVGRHVTDLDGRRQFRYEPSGEFLVARIVCGLDETMREAIDQAMLERIAPTARHWFAAANRGTTAGLNSLCTLETDRLWTARHSVSREEACAGRLTGLDLDSERPLEDEDVPPEPKVERVDHEPGTRHARVVASAGDRPLPVSRFELGLVLDGSWRVDEVREIRVLTEPRNAIDLRSGTELRIELRENQAAGFEWRLARRPNGRVLRPTGSSFAHPDPGPQVEGADGVRTLSFQAVARGRTALELEYRFAEDDEDEPMLERRLRVRVR